MHKLSIARREKLVPKSVVRFGIPLPGMAPKTRSKGYASDDHQWMDNVAMPNTIRKFDDNT